MGHDLAALNTNTSTAMSEIIDESRQKDSNTPKILTEHSQQFNLIKDLVNKITGNPVPSDQVFAFDGYMQGHPCQALECQSMGVC